MWAHCLQLLVCRNTKISITLYCLGKSLQHYDLTKLQILSDAQPKVNIPLKDASIRREEERQSYL